MPARQAPSARFHYFTQLPPELQEMIWELWRETQPVFRHYVTVHRRGRSYAAYDVGRKRLVPRTARSVVRIPGRRPSPEVPLDPQESKIRFSGPVATWINFARDTVFVNNTGYKFPGTLRPLSHIGCMQPKQVANTHWTKYLRQIAMPVPRAEDIPDLRSYDLGVLTQLTRLKTVYLDVISLGRTATLARANGTIRPDQVLLNGYVDIAHVKPLIGTVYTDVDKHHDQREEATTLANDASHILRQHFDDIGRAVDIRIVADASLEDIPIQEGRLVK
ncbi:hypothetical protein F4778DRAFT_789984 [Xylariomycetidae sp. FL2044]|nr:hypothetical protein F4778DRAFT_789984 [Xylariomycetidae sp. FL2044]